MVLAGLKILIIGSSHLAYPGSLVTTLHDNLLSEGAEVHTIGVCGSLPTSWLQPTKGTCGGAERVGKGPIKLSLNNTAVTTPIDKLIEKEHPNLVLIVMGDTLANYSKADFSPTWVSGELAQFTNELIKLNVKCTWIGPGWGNDGPSISNKTNERVLQLSNFLSSRVKPCTYINSLNMSKPGEWSTFDGQHYKPPGYLSWSKEIIKALK